MVKEASVEEHSKNKLVVRHCKRCKGNLNRFLKNSDDFKADGNFVSWPLASTLKGLSFGKLAFYSKVN